MGHDSDYAFTKEGLFANWNRHKAYFLGKCNFKTIDLVIPMAFLRKDHDGQYIVDLDSMAYIVISVKNKTSGAELKRQNYLSTSEVEGVLGENETVRGWSWGERISCFTVEWQTADWVTACEG